MRVTAAEGMRACSVLRANASDSLSATGRAKVQADFEGSQAGEDFFDEIARIQAKVKEYISEIESTSFE